MNPTIRIDEDVYEWLQQQAVPFEDTPNLVLRRIAGLEGNSGTEHAAQEASMETKKAYPGRRPPMASGPQLISRWRIPAKQARFHREGRWYEHLSDFPAAFCDPDGYIVFESEKQYRDCSFLNLGKQVNVPKGISQIRGYVKVEDRIS